MKLLPLVLLGSILFLLFLLLLGFLPHSTKFFNLFYKTVTTELCVSYVHAGPMIWAPWARLILLIVFRVSTVNTHLKRNIFYLFFGETYTSSLKTFKLASTDNTHDRIAMDRGRKKKQNKTNNSPLIVELFK